MSIKLLPSRDDLKQRGKWLLRGFVAILILTVLVWLVSVNVILLPVAAQEASWFAVMGEHTENIQLRFIIQDAILNPFIPHALSLVEIADRADSIEINRDDLERLLQLDNTRDAFCLNFRDSSGFTARNVLPVGNLMELLELRQCDYARKRTINRGLVKGMVNYKTLSVKGNNYILIFRDFRPYPAMKAEGVVGLAYDEKAFLAALPSRLDSLARDNWNMKLFGVGLYDTRQALGVLHENDTLWWQGNRMLKIGKFDYSNRNEYTGSVMNIEGLGLSIRVRTDPEWRMRLVRMVKFIKLYTWTVQLVALIMIVILVIMISMARKQSRRNRIALAHIAHSVKTPVARLRPGADLLTEEQVASPDEERRLVKSISDECDRLERAVQNSALSLDKGKLTLNPELCDLTQLIKDIGEAWKPAFDQSGVSLVVECDEKPLMVSFDSEMITVMLDNLVDNALRHAYLNLANIPEGEAMVKLRLSRTRDKAQITVEDSGPGIPKPERKLIFKRFRRSKSDALTGVSGLGLGLALVKEIAEAHGGDVRVEDSNLGGAKFSVELPVSQ